MSLPRADRRRIRALIWTKGILIGERQAGWIAEIPFSTIQASGMLLGVNGRRSMNEQVQLERIRHRLITGIIRMKVIAGIKLRQKSGGVRRIESCTIEIYSAIAAAA